MGYDCGACEDNQWAYLLVAAILWGIGDAVWNTQISAVIGGSFSDAKEDAFANLKMWQSLFVAISLIYNPYLEPVPKLGILLGLLATSIPCYFIFVTIQSKETEDKPVTRPLLDNANADDTA